MKIPFTLLQTALTAASCFLLCCCAAGDGLVFYLSLYGDNKLTFAVNGVLSLTALLLSLLFICKPSITGFVSKSSDEAADPIPALSAARTYICFISLDAAVALALMLFGTAYSESAVKYILTVTPAVFAVGAVKYFIDIRKIGVETDDVSE